MDGFRCDENFDRSYFDLEDFDWTDFDWTTFDWVDFDSATFDLVDTSFSRGAFLFWRDLSPYAPLLVGSTEGGIG